jgi:hypothetical protein
VLTRTLCVAVGALAIWFASSAGATAGVIVASDATIGATTSSSASLASSQTPSAPEPVKPNIRDLAQASLLYGPTNNTGGAGAPAPTSGPGSGLVAFVSERPATAPNTLISRLSLFSRIALPSPLEDRFFRPPRA